MKKAFVLFCMILLVTTGCRGKIFSKDSIFAPKPFRLGGPPRDAHPDYLAGWDAGCETGLSTMVPSFYKQFYGFNQDPYMMNKARYYKAWKDSYHYCRHYAFRFIWDAYDKTVNKQNNNLCVLCPNELERSQ